jgi:hypothetical protein
MTGKSTIAALLALLLAASLTVSSTSAAVAAPQTTPASASALRVPPKVIQLQYAQWYEEPGGSLGAFARGHPDSLRFATRYRGRQATVPAKETDTVDTDLPRCCDESWEPIRRQGAARVYRLIRKALDRRGVAKVRTRVKRGGLADIHRWRIVLARCSQDPPSYPVDCEIAPNGEHY